MAPRHADNIAEVHRQRGDVDEAYRWYQRALKAKPDHEHAQKRLDSRLDDWWKKRNAALDAELAAEITPEPTE